MKPLKRAVIKEELVALAGHYMPALILNHFLHLFEISSHIDEYLNDILDNFEGHNAYRPDIELTNGWIYKSTKQLIGELMVGVSTQTIRKYIKELVDNGWLDERLNTRYVWDRTLEYKPNIDKIQSDLMMMGYALDGYKLIGEKSD